MNWVATAIVLAIAWLMTTEPALAERKVAFVVGNSAYLHVPRLPNPRDDAADLIAATFGDEADEAAA